MASSEVNSIMSRPPEPPFLRVPAEIRLIIYRLLLSNHENGVLRIRTEDPTMYGRRKQKQQSRRKFRHMVDRMHSRSAESTYCLDSPGLNLHASILSINRRIYAEASHVLYSGHTFDFGMDIECILPFFQDLTPSTLKLVKRIKMVKRSIPYTKDFDRCEWRNACEFISRMELQVLDLEILEGTPSLANRPALNWKQNSTFDKADFETIAKLEAMEDEMGWVRQVLQIRVQVLNVKAVLEHCPVPGSKAMAFFVNFSASIEKGFTDYLKSHMLRQPV